MNMLILKQKLLSFFFLFIFPFQYKKKFRIRETPNLLTNADRSTVLKANYFVQSQCSDPKFCEETCVKNDIKKLRSLIKNSRRFANILRNWVIAWLQLLGALIENKTMPPGLAVHRLRWCPAFGWAGCIIIRKFPVDKHAHKPSRASPHRRHAWYVGDPVLHCVLYSAVYTVQYTTVWTVQYTTVYTAKLATVYTVHYTTVDIAQYTTEPWV